MAKDSGDNTILYLIGAVAAYYLFLRPAKQAIVATPAIQTQTRYLGPAVPVETVATRWLREGVTIGPGQTLPVAPTGYQWYTPPVGNPADFTAYSLEPLGTVHSVINFKEIA